MNDLRPQIRKIVLARWLETVEAKTVGWTDDFRRAWEIANAPDADKIAQAVQDLIEEKDEKAEEQRRPPPL